MRAAVFLALCLGSLTPAFADGLKLEAGPAFIAEDGEMSVSLNAPLLDALGLQIERTDGQRRQQADVLRWSLKGRYSFDAPGDHVSRFYEASMALQGGLTLRVGKRERQLGALRIEPRTSADNEFAVLDQNDALSY